MKMPVLSVIQNSLQRVVLTAFIAATLSLNLSAEPEWWTGEPKELLAAAQQNNKSIVLYFESKVAPDCIKMDDETWASLDAESSQKFLWKRCTSGDPKDEKFFETYQINSAPEIVVIDSQRRERGRLRGFIAPDLILGILDGLPSYDEEGADKVLTFGDGMIFTPEEVRDSSFDVTKHSYYLQENFDSISDINELSKSFFDPYVNPGQSMGIVPDEGMFKTNALIVTGAHKTKLSLQMNPTVAMRVDLSANFKKVNMVVGIVEARFRMCVLALPPGNNLEVFALTVLPKTSKAPEIKDILGRYRKSSRFFPSSNDHTAWREITLQSSKPVNLKNEAVWLSFWVDETADAFLVDDIRVRLLTVEQAKAADEMRLPEVANPNDILEKTQKPALGFYFLKFDANKDLLIEKKEFPGYEKNMINITEKKHGKNFDSWFAERDKDKSGALDPTEYPR